MNIDIVLQRLGATIGAQQLEIELLRQENSELKEQLRQENAELKEQTKEKQDGNNAT